MIKGEKEMYNKVEETQHYLQGLGMDINSLKARGETTVSIHKYEEVLEMLIEITRQVNQMGVNAGFIK